MENFLGFFFFLVLVMSILLILLPADDDREHDRQRKTSRKFKGKTKGSDLKTKTIPGFVSKSKLIHDLGESAQELSDKNGESPKNEEVEIVGLIKNNDIEESGSENGVVEECKEVNKEENVNDESRETVNPGEIEINLTKSDLRLGENEGIEVYKIDGGVKEDALVVDKEEEKEDDWEGIERSELERVFAAAVVYVASKDNGDKVTSIGSDLRLKLYGLHKIATRGPCHLPQPMALKVFARSKWNAWQQLGNMSPEVAMEQYINLLSTTIPGWMKTVLGGDGKQGFADNEASRKLVSDLKTCMRTQQDALDERNAKKQIRCTEALDLGPTSLKNVK